MADKSVIEGIEQRIAALIEDHRRLRATCRELTSERDVLRAANRVLEERTRQLNAEIARMQLTAALSGPGATGEGSAKGDRDKARARVNRLMREVDKCIALVAASAAEKRDDE